MQAIAAVFSVPPESNDPPDERRFIVEKSSSNKLLYILPLLAGFMWGSEGTFVRWLGSAGFANINIVSVRMVFSVIIMFLWILIYDRSLFKIKLKDIWLFIIAGLIGMLALNFCYNEAILNVPISLAAVLLDLAPIFVMILSAFIFRESTTARKWICAFISIFGCVLVSGLIQNGMGGNWNRGIIFGLMATLFYALYTVFANATLNRSYSVYTIVFYSVVTIHVVLIPFSDYSLMIDYVQSSPVKSILTLIGNSMFISVLPYIFFTGALKYLDSGFTAILASGTEPIAATIFGMVFFSEMPKALQVVGVIIVVVAIAVLCLPDKNASSGGEVDSAAA